jgi:hypothetical protein
MNEAAIIARLTEALAHAADSEAGAKTALVSINVEMAAAPASGGAHVALNRKTRTLVFMRAEFKGEDGALIAAAASVHKVIA